MIQVEEPLGSLLTHSLLLILILLLLLILLLILLLLLLIILIKPINQIIIRILLPLGIRLRFSLLVRLGLLLAEAGGKKLLVFDLVESTVDGHSGIACDHQADDDLDD